MSKLLVNQIKPYTGNTVEINGIFINNGALSATTYQNLPTDIYVTGGTYSSGNATFANNTGGTFSVTGFTTPFSGGSVTGLTATTISATTYLGLPTDIRVTGGTYSSGTAIFTNNTGGTFSVSGFTTPFSGGSVTGLTATTISATTFYGDGSNLTGMSLSPISVSGTSLYSINPSTSEFNGTDGVFFGQNAGYTATNASQSNFIGFNAGNGAVNAESSNFFGVNAGYNATNAAYSSLIGYQAGYSYVGNNIGSNNIIIGTNVTLADGTADGINIGGVLFGAGANSNIAGNPLTGATTSGKIGIRVPIPTSTLDVSGSTGYDQFRMRTSYTPTGSGDTNGNVGDIAWDNSYIYLKTNTGWGRFGLNYGF